MCCAAEKVLCPVQPVLLSLSMVLPTVPTVKVTNRIVGAGVVSKLPFTILFS